MSGDMMIFGQGQPMSAEFRSAHAGSIAIVSAGKAYGTVANHAANRAGSQDFYRDCMSRHHLAPFETGVVIVSADDGPLQGVTF